MKKRYWIVMLFVLMFCISAVSASQDINISDDAHALSENQDMEHILNDGSNGETDNQDNENGDGPNSGTNNAEENGIDESNGKVNVTIKINEEKTQYKATDKFEFKLIDGDNNAIKNATAMIRFDEGVDFEVVTNDEGIGSEQIGLSSGNHTVTVTYQNQSVTKNIQVIKETQSNNNTKPVVAKISKVKTKNISTTYGKVKYTVTVLDNNGKGISGKKVTIQIGKNKYYANTASNGVATFTLNYASGKYVIKYYVEKFSGSNSYVVKNKITLTILKWGLKGDVTKSKLIKKNMPNNAWVKKAVAATKKGIPLLTFKGGSGKVVFMTAGVHGNELSSQVAAMKMIKYLSDHPIKGTVYMIPFVNVKAISKKVRFTDKDFNRVAAKSGTISNNIVKLVSKYKCDAYGDFHTTKPGGAPGKNIVMGSKSPAKSSATLTKYIAKNCKVNQRIYKYAGQQYPGALADNVNNNGIPAVICEVVLPHNTVTSKSVSISFNMMKHLLKFNSII